MRWAISSSWRAQRSPAPTCLATQKWVAANYWRTPVQESNDKKAKAKSNPTSSQARQLLTKTLAYLGEKDNDHNLQRLAKRREKQGK